MKSLMSLNRFEAFSDGVFAIAMTLLVIEIKLPDLSRTAPAAVIGEMWHIAPHLLSYMTSFLVIGVVWLNHHALFYLLKRVDRVVLTINLILLMCIAFIPYSTALIGNYGKLQPVVVFYGCSLTITGVVYNLLWFYIVRQYLWSHRQYRKFIFNASLWSLGYPTLYAVATLSAWVNSGVSVTFYILIPLFYLFPSVIDQQLENLPDASFQPASDPQSTSGENK
ncbi:TMEM175 family protein [Gloeocapsa sp. BRSZ]